MSFTDAQKTDIRFFLGYPSILYQFNHRLENAMNVAGDQPSVQAKVEVLLSKLNTIFGTDPLNPSQIDQVFKSLGLEEIEDRDTRLKFGNSSTNAGQFTNSKLNSLADYGRMTANALSILIGVGIANNIFGKSGYQGDSWVAQNNYPISIKTHLMGC